MPRSVLYVEMLLDDQRRAADCGNRAVRRTDPPLAEEVSDMHGVTTPDGTQIQRAMLGSLRKQRAHAQSKLEDFLETP